ncbi:hypothetical protein CX682_06200 [Pseudomonas sp. FFUP_PS_41]|nr:hypothetical protein CX682_06200 [Pseudomonas sp. FFUP_PS_41]
MVIKLVAPKIFFVNVCVISRFISAWTFVFIFMDSNFRAVKVSPGLINAIIFRPQEASLS